MARTVLKFKGRKRTTTNSDNFRIQYERYMRREINKKELAKVLNISRPTLDKYIVKYKEKSANEKGVLISV